MSLGAMISKTARMRWVHASAAVWIVLLTASALWRRAMTHGRARGCDVGAAPGAMCARGATLSPAAPDAAALVLKGPGAELRPVLQRACRRGPNRR
jgi:hypothetical protein